MDAKTKRAIARVRNAYLRPKTYMMDAELITAHDQNGAPITFHGSVPVRHFPFELLGQGYFSRVYVIDDDHVLKVTKRGPDAGYGRYLYQAMLHQHNPYFPRVYYAAMFDGQCVYVLERLDSFEYDSDHHSQMRAISSILHMDAPLRDLMAPLCPHLREFVDVMREHNMYSDIKQDNTMVRKCGQLVFTDPCSTC